MTLQQSAWPSQGCGAGLRTKHYLTVLATRPKMDYFQAVTENFMESEGRAFQLLLEMRVHYPVALHGVALSIGGTDPLGEPYLKKLKELVERIEPVNISDRLCWTGAAGENLFDFLPLPFTEETMKHVTRRLQYVQEFLKKQILMENISTHVTFKHSQIPEWEFMREVARRSGCGLSLDLNSLFANAANHRFDTTRYLESILPSMVGQLHLSVPAMPEVWRLYEKALRLYGQVSTLVEGGDASLDLSHLNGEVEKARQLYDRARKKKPLEVPAVPLYFPESPVKGPALPIVQQELKQRIKTRQNDSPETGWLNPQNGAKGEERLLLYAEAYRTRCVEILSEVYEGVQHVLGVEAFVELIRQYVEKYPSQNYNLDSLGMDMASFIEKTEFPQQWPFLPDLARLEWQTRQALYAFNQPSFDPATLAALDEEDWEKMHVTFQPCVAVLASSWPVHDVWRTRKMPSDQASVDIVDRPQQVLIYFQNGSVSCELIEKTQYEVLRALLQGAELGAVCERVAQEAGTEELPLEQWFLSWTGFGLITHVHVPGKDLSVLKEAIRDGGIAEQQQQ